MALGSSFSFGIVGEYCLDQWGVGETRSDWTRICGASSAARELVIPSIAPLEAAIEVCKGIPV